MSDARGILVGGASAGQVVLLRERVEAALAATRAECHARRATLQDLPAPSRHAYAYLAGLDFGAIPVHTDPGRQATDVRIKHLLRLRDRMQRDLARLAGSGLETPGTGNEAVLEGIRAECAEIVHRVEADLARRGATADGLPDPSRRAFRWFRWLAEASHLHAHQQAAVACLHVDARVEVEFYNQAALYRSKWEGERIRLTVHEAFTPAPEEVLTALVKVVLPFTRKRRWRETIRRYVEGEPFRQAMTVLDGGGHGRARAGRGRAYDLGELYEHVNRVHLGGKVARPGLTWTDRPTGREFGSYQPLTDTLTISVTLDSPGVPRFVLEHVMHHELLHKLLGMPGANGRRRVHTAGFRRAERAFPRYQDADEFLRRLARRHLAS